MRLRDGKVGNDVLDRLGQVGQVLVSDVAGIDDGAEVVEGSVEASGVYTWVRHGQKISLDLVDVLPESPMRA